jgi:hypothetical protein
MSLLDGHGSAGCPAAESLVPNTHWTNRTLAAGVVMSAGTAHDAKGSVNIHVLRVNLNNPRVRVEPLLGKLAERRPLSVLAQRHAHLVAATNTGYFDFISGAPTEPLIVGGKPLVLSKRHELVVGIGHNGRFEAGKVWLSSAAVAAGKPQQVVAVNETHPPSGLGVFTSSWGGARVPGGWSTTLRGVTHNLIDILTRSRRATTVPGGGYLLQGRGAPASSWLSALSAGTKVSLAATVKTTAAEPFVQAYGVGAQLVAKSGVVKTGFTCNSANTKQPARTAIGWTDGGRDVVIAVVADHLGTSMHGLDEDQMSKLMVQLGVSQAYAFDGSGSTELLAKLPGAVSLTLQNYPADGAERPMPLGLGITVSPQHG